MILLSNGGTNTHTATAASGTLAVGTVDGVAVLRRDGGRWLLSHKGLQGCNVSAVTQTPCGTLFAATHGIGVARSRDEGVTWQWCNDGVAHFDLWSARGGWLKGREVVCIGCLPAHVYISEDDGDSWRPLPALREVASAPEWSSAAAQRRPCQGDRARRGPADGRHRDRRPAGVDRFRRELHGV